MKKYVKTYMDYFDYGIEDVILCEKCSAVAVDICHIIPKSRGGKDIIENLAALCRRHHEESEGHPEMIQEIHNNNLKQTR